MKKLIKTFVFGLIIFATCFVGGKIDSVEASQIDFVEPCLATATLPSSYDLRDYIHIEVENQHTFGICYTFASLTSLETYLALHYNEYYDFSEMHFATSLCLQDNYHPTIDTALQSGGNFNHFMLYTQKDKSLVLEQEMPIENYLSLGTTSRENKLKTDFNNINNNFYTIAKVNDTKSYAEFIGNKDNFDPTELQSFRNDVKKHLMTYGSLTANIHTKTGGFNGNTVSYRVINDSLVTDEATINNSSDHMISIVGWDDNYDANGAWENKGAYLCLNSWGKNFGLDGYFYVSYDDYFIEGDINGVTSASLSTTNNKISTITNNQNKTTTYTHVFNSVKPNVFIANIFDTSQYIGEKITNIDTFVLGSTSKFYIKFFNSYNNALNGINTVTSSVNATKVDTFTMYDKYTLTTPLSITNNYMVIVNEIRNTYEMNSLGGYTSLNLNLPTTYYYQGSNVGHFDINNTIWDPTVPNKQLDFTIPFIIHTDKQYIKVNAFTSDDEYSIDGQHVQNNAIYTNKTITLKLDNTSITSNDVANIKITKLFENSFADITSNFNITQTALNTISIEMTSITGINYNASKNNYLISIPCGENKIYRVVSIIQDIITYNINYELNGGQVNNNPTTYTNTHSSITLNSPTKDGFEFVGWFTNEALTQPFDLTNLPYTDLTLYAKYQIAPPQIISKSNNVAVVYSKNLNVTINIVATHSSLSPTNTLSYQWFMRKKSTDDFVPVSGATSSSLTLNNVNQSGFYACQVTLNLSDGTSTVLQPSQTNAISVDIKPLIYDMSKVVWNYTNELCYNGQLQKVELINLPQGVTATYTNNEFADVGNYTATASLNYEGAIDGNAYAEPIDNLNWAIRKAKLKITIQDIIRTSPINEDELKNLYHCSIDCEYFPDDVITYQNKLDYLNLKFVLQPTSNVNVFIITATTNTFDFYDKTIISGKYRVVIHSLTDGDITTTSKIGFAQNCEFEVSPYIEDETTSKILKDNKLNTLLGYNISYSYLDSEAIVNIPLSRQMLLSGLSVYMLKNGKLTKLDCSTSKNGITFTTSEQDATYLIVQQSSDLSNSQMLLLILIIAILASLCIGAIAVSIRHKHNYY